MRTYSSEAVSDDYLHVNSCDCQYLFGNDTSCTRLNGRMDYHILYVAAGCCIVTEGDEVIQVPAGSVIIYRPHEPQQYKYDNTVKSISYYVHFSGTGCEELLDKFCLNEGRVFEIGLSHRLETTWTNMIEDFHIKEPFYEQFCHSHLLRILSIIGARIYNAEKIPDAGINNKIIEILKIMHNEYSENKSISYYANIFGLSESRFTHIFKEYAKVSPNKYLLNIKMMKAKELLENTDLPMSQVAALVGIPDQNYFSRLFKQHIGYSPKTYQLRNKNS